MKRLLILFLALLLVTLCACSRPKPPREPSSVPSVPLPEPAPESEMQPELDPLTPECAVADLFEGAKAWDVEKINSLLLAGVDVRTYVKPEFEGKLREVLARLEYRVGDCKISGDTAVVEVEVTSVDAKSAVESAVSDIAIYVMKSKVAGKDVSYEELAGVAVDALDIPALPGKTTTAQAHMVRDGEEWKLDIKNTDNMPLLNAVSGGVVELYGEIKELMDTYGITLNG